MIISKVHLFYFSPTHTTKKIVESIGKGTGFPCEIHDLTFSCDDIKKYEVKKNELTIVGIPVYGGRTPVITRDMIKNIKGDNSLVVPVVVYGNRAYEDCLLELKNMLKENSFIAIAGGAFIGEHSYTRKVGTNRPDDIDIQMAENFGKAIAEKIKNDSYTKDIFVKGNFPYKNEMPKAVFAPVPNDKCKDCGKCAKVCPTSAIDKNNHRNINPEKCIRCFACVRTCPFEARGFIGNPIEKILNFLETTCTDRKEPEIFI